MTKKKAYDQRLMYSDHITQYRYFLSCAHAYLESSDQLDTSWSGLNDEPSVHDVQADFEHKCTARNFGQWLTVLMNNDRSEFPKWIAPIVRNRYWSVNAQRKAEFVLSAMNVPGNFTVTASVSDDSFSKEDLSHLTALCAVENSVGGSVSIARGLKQLYLLHDYRIAQPIWTNLQRSKKTNKPGPVSSPDLAEPQPDVRPPTGNRAGVAVHETVCSLIDDRLSELSAATISADSVYLAAELTRHPSWVLVFETPLGVHRGREQTSIAGMSVTSGAASISVEFIPSSGSARMPSVRIPKAGSRTFVTHSSEVVAIIVLAVLFESGDKLVKTHADWDHRIIKRVTSLIAKASTATYRTTGDITWEAESSATIQAIRFSSGARTPHDTRGYFQMRRGKKVAVKAYRTGKE
ncbi:hypothetical protein GCM10009689_17260 [Brevibacterium antiquum]|uniref:hypothetical protein n=1 Tax=Brevibacterium antiquum TaxID=234835 RepID=UPI0018DF16D3|nr:hypothetical protein [Brevibacterium antiquum]